jgi:dolichyl-phosphate-mannose--protein O-mannosyl transferase
MQRDFMIQAKNPLKKQSPPSLPWFSLGLGAIFLVSLALRFWGLDRFNALVFDEVYYAKFANNYLTGTPFFNAHPPLSQYIIAIGMWIGSHLPIGQETTNSLTGSLRSTWSYRWLNALTGSFIPLVVAALAYQLGRRRSFALIAALFAAADGLFLVESRYALNNIYLVILGLLAQVFFLRALVRQGGQRQKMLVLSGIFFGACAAIKWNGLWFLLGVYTLWAVAWVLRWRQREASKPPQHYGPPRHPLQNLTQLNALQVCLYLGVLPVLTYSLLWIPHLIMNPTPGFWEAQVRILSFHEKIGSGAEVHPYCSRWFTWPLMWRPVAYLYQTARNFTEQVPAYPPLPRDAVRVIYDVHAMGNPILWWLSTAAILLLLLLLIQRLLEGVGWKIPPTPYTWIALYLVANYAANLLPWSRVSRCTFLYHYMGASVFSGLALAWLVDRWLRSDRPHYRSAGMTIILLILLAFIFWLPIYLGLPLSVEGHQLRMWFRSWI